MFIDLYMILVKLLPNVKNMIHEEKGQKDNNFANPA